MQSRTASVAEERRHGQELEDAVDQLLGRGNPSARLGVREVDPRGHLVREDHRDGEGHERAVRHEEQRSEDDDADLGELRQMQRGFTPPAGLLDARRAVAQPVRITRHEPQRQHDGRDQAQRGAVHGRSASSPPPRAAVGARRAPPSSRWSS